MKFPSFPHEKPVDLLGDPAMLVARNEKIKNTGRWKPRYNNLEKITTDAWRWERKLNRIGG